MNNLIEKLEEYFENTPKEQIQEDWEATEEFDEIGITIEELFEQIKY